MWTAPLFVWSSPLLFDFGICGTNEQYDHLSPQAFHTLWSMYYFRPEFNLLCSPTRQSCICNIQTMQRLCKLNGHSVNLKFNSIPCVTHLASINLTLVFKPGCEKLYANEPSNDVAHRLLANVSHILISISNKKVIQAYCRSCAS